MWANLVMAILAVNKYSLERVVQQFPELANAGLFEPDNLCAFDVDTIANRLLSAGYDRGPWLTKFMATRLKALGSWVSKQDRPSVENALKKGSREQLASLLGSIKVGVGPTVLETFIQLRGQRDAL
jgi:hypothetical protein